MDQIGKYALIRGSEVLSTWSTYEDAIQEGYKVCGLNDRFLVKKIELFEQVHFNSRMSYNSMLSFVTISF
jgi:hypothetical protein